MNKLHQTCLICGSLCALGFAYIYYQHQKIKRLQQELEEKHRLELLLPTHKEESISLNEENTEQETPTFIAPKEVLPKIEEEIVIEKEVPVDKTRLLSLEEVQNLSERK